MEKGKFLLTCYRPLDHLGIVKDLKNINSGNPSLAPTLNTILTTFWTIIHRGKDVGPSLEGQNPSWVPNFGVILAPSQKKSLPIVEV